jgi:N-acetyl-anhydromuramyl-L-alanine amidase AmpD
LSEIHVYGNDAAKLIITKENRKADVEEVSQAEVNSLQEMLAENGYGRAASEIRRETLSERTWSFGER